MIWCNVHQRPFWECKHKGGITLPCQKVDLREDLEFAVDQYSDSCIAAVIARARANGVI